MHLIFNLAHMFLIGLSFATFSCKSPHSSQGSDLEAAQVAGGQFGQFKGLDSISKIISARVWVDDSFNLVTTIPENVGFRNLQNVLGTYEGVGTKNKFTNGAPNALNMLLWSTMMQNFSQWLVNSSNISCDYVQLYLNKAAKSLFTPTCNEKHMDDDSSGKKNVASWKSNPKKLWELLIQEDAPETEYTAWAAWIKSKDFNDFYTTEGEKLEAAIAAILLNPYFLLEN